MNSVQVMGNLARDPQIRATKTGRAVASFSIAVNRNYTTPQGEQRELTDWINVVAWGNLAQHRRIRDLRAAKAIVSLKVILTSLVIPTMMRIFHSDFPVLEEI